MSDPLSIYGGLYPSKTCTHPGCERTDTTVMTGVQGRRCPDHPPTYWHAYLRHLIALGMTGTAVSYLRAQRPWRDAA